MHLGRERDRARRRKSLLTEIPLPRSYSDFLWLAAKRLVGNRHLVSLSSPHLVTPAHAAILTAMSRIAKTPKRIAITTGGGDAPGLNAVIRAVTLAAIERGWECIGICNGYDGILHPEEFPEGGTIALTRDVVRGIAHTGGTILGTTNRGNPFANEVARADGTVERQDLSGRLLEGFGDLGIEAVVAVGGDGSMEIASRVADLGIKVVGVPKTIDNDLDGTVSTFGFYTAVSYATDAIGRLHSTA